MFPLFILLSLATLAVTSQLLDATSSTNILSRSSLLSANCSSDVISCHNTTVQENTCCFEAPGGLLMQTQFWDTQPSTGPSDSWTIHGLWPDNCDGTYEASCDPSRAYTNLEELLATNGGDTLSFMKTYWVDIKGDDLKLWKHEWSKHGTCMSTLNPSCLPDGSAQGAEAVAYFQIVVKLFKDLPTYSWLAKAGITPSTSKTLTRSELSSALRAGFGQTPSLDCKSGVLNQVSYYYNLKGSAIDGTFVPIDAPKRGSCPSSGIKYSPKNGSDSPTTTDGAVEPTTTHTRRRPTTTRKPRKPTVTVTPTKTSEKGDLDLFSKEIVG